MEQKKFEGWCIIAIIAGLLILGAMQVSNHSNTPSCPGCVAPAAQDAAGY